VESVSSVRTATTFKSGDLTLMARIALCDASGPLTDLLQKLSGEEGDSWLPRLNKFLRSQPPLVPADKEPLLIIPLGTVNVPVVMKSCAPVIIAHIFTSSFEDWFGEIEQPFAVTTLKYGKLSRMAKDDEIIAELGGEKKIEITIRDVYGLISLQPNGQEGALLTNWVNLFYVRDARGIPRAVKVHWYAVSGVWYVDAEGGWVMLNERPSGCRVFFPNS